MRTYYLLNVLCFVVLLFLPVHSQPNNAGMTKVTGQDKPLNVPADKAKDSLLRLTDRELDEAIKKSALTIKKKQVDLIEAKKIKREALQELLTAVNDFMKVSGRKEVIVFKNEKDAITQLKDGEVFLTKDSTCVKERKPLFGKRKCVQWSYDFYLEDKNGKKEKL